MEEDNYNLQDKIDNLKAELAKIKKNEDKNCTHGKDIEELKKQLFDQEEGFNSRKEYSFKHSDISYENKPHLFDQKDVFLGKDKIIGHFISKGRTAHGRAVYQGSKGGYYHMTANFNKTYLP